MLARQLSKAAPWLGSAHRLTAEEHQEIVTAVVRLLVLCFSKVQGPCRFLRIRIHASKY